MLWLLVRGISSSPPWLQGFQINAAVSMLRLIIIWKLTPKHQQQRWWTSMTQILHAFSWAASNWTILEKNTPTHPGFVPPCPPRKTFKSQWFWEILSPGSALSATTWKAKHLRAAGEKQARRWVMKSLVKLTNLKWHNKIKNRRRISAFLSTRDTSSSSPRRKPPSSSWAGRSTRPRRPISIDNHITANSTRRCQTKGKAKARS